MKTTNIQHRPFVLLLKNSVLQLATCFGGMGGPVEKMGGGRGEGRINMRGDEHEWESSEEGITK